MLAFVPTGLALSVRSGSFTAQKCNVNARPVIRRAQAAPKMMVESTLATLPVLPVAGLEVTFPAYLAIFLGTLIPCAFLVILYIQGESRKAGEKAGRDSRN